MTLYTPTPTLYSTDETQMPDELGASSFPLVHSPSCLLQRFPCHHEVHGSKDSEEPTPLASPSTLLKHLLDFVSPSGNQPKALTDPKDISRDKLAQGRELKPEVQRVVRGMKRHPPGFTIKVAVQRSITSFNNLEA